MGPRRLPCWPGHRLAVGKASSNRTTVNKKYMPQGMEESDNDSCYAKDHLGSVREVTTSDGSTATRCDYDPYGRA
jgi:uncharacterized protein RhaS with RHS repeats